MRKHKTDDTPPPFVCMIENLATPQHEQHAPFYSSLQMRQSIFGFQMKNGELRDNKFQKGLFCQVIDIQTLHQGYQRQGKRVCCLESSLFVQYQRHYSLL